MKTEIYESMNLSKELAERLLRELPEVELVLDRYYLRCMPDTAFIQTGILFTPYPKVHVANGETIKAYRVI